MLHLDHGKVHYIDNIYDFVVTIEEKFIHQNQAVGICWSADFEEKSYNSIQLWMESFRNPLYLQMKDIHVQENAETSGTMFNLRVVRSLGNNSERHVYCRRRERTDGTDGWTLVYEVVATGNDHNL